MTARADMRIVLHSPKVLKNGGVRVDVTIQGADTGDVEAVRRAIAIFMDFHIGSGAWAGPGTGADTVREVA